MLSKTILRSGAAAAFLLGAGLISSAQRPVRPGQAQPPVKVQVGGTQVQVGDANVGSSATYRAKQILGSKIMIQNNTQIGTVDDIVFDQAGNLEYLIVANDNGKMVTVPWEAAKFNLKSQTGVVNITPDVYKNLPTYTTTTYPDFFAPAYRTTTYKYYGLTPGQLRRFNRIVRP
jgi:sporulation protein YlmC with PRC-barrel domain